jgi:hypothetical protein
MRGIDMKANLIASALEREKELFEQILELAECQPELLESGRAEDLEVLLSLRSASLFELNAAEDVIEAEFDTGVMTTEELEEINQLNLAILGLADRIANLDEQFEFLADADCALADDHAESGASCSE